jgi:hypothetical protein
VILFRQGLEVLIRLLDVTGFFGKSTALPLSAFPTASSRSRDAPD